MATMLTSEEKTEIAVAEAKLRVLNIREAAQREREEHQAALAREAEESKTELELVLEALKEPERRQVRLQAYLHILAGNHDTPSNLQAAVDQMTLRLGRYMATGQI